MHAFLVGPYLVFIASLMRALAVRAKLASPLCRRCGLRYERSQLGERVCSCAR